MPADILVTTAPLVAHPDPPDPRGAALATLAAAALADAAPEAVFWWERDAPWSALQAIDQAGAIARFLLDLPSVRTVLHLGCPGPAGPAAITVPSSGAARGGYLSTPYAGGRHPDDSWERNTLDRERAAAIVRAAATALPFTWAGDGVQHEYETAWGRGRTGLDGFPPSRVPLLAATCPLRDRLVRLCFDLGGHQAPALARPDAPRRLAAAILAALHRPVTPVSRGDGYARPVPPALYHGQPYLHRTPEGALMLPVQPRTWRAARLAARRQWPSAAAPRTGRPVQPGALARFAYVTAAPDGSLWLVSENGHYCQAEDFVLPPEEARKPLRRPRR